ncbi:MAG TPA: hypothetical protein VHN99_08335, partial [Deinococcales bacterium]|nr:hypothetical protein [Deinococcales bacterium]
MRAYDLTNLQLLLAKTDQQPELSVPSSTAYPIGMPLRDFLLAWAERPEGYPAGSVRVFRRTGQTFVAGSDDLLNAIEGLRGATMLPVQAVELEP